MKHGVRWAALVALALGGSAEPAGAEFVLQDTDRVVLFGDSSLSDAYSFDGVDQFLRSKYPQFKGEFIRFGAARSSAADGNRRYPLEVAPLKPTRVVLSFGLDDPERKPLDQGRLATYVAEMGKLIDAVRAGGAEAAVFTPPPPDESRNRGLATANYDAVIAAYADALRTLAREKDVPVLDWNAAVKEYLTSDTSGRTRHWTKHGLAPAPLSVAIATDLLLAHWQAEPIEYLATAKWGTAEGASASTGTIEVALAGEKEMTLRLTGVPVVFDPRDRLDYAEDRWPLAKWCNCRLKIEDMPQGGVIISEGGRAAKPFLSQQLAEGADLTVVGPLADNPVCAALANAVRTKMLQYEHYRAFVHQAAPEPELTEGYALWLAAYKEMAAATHKIVCRTPSRVDLTLDIAYADVAKLQQEAAKREGPAAGKAAPRPRPAPPKPTPQ